jgi:hypothetical protein
MSSRALVSVLNVILAVFQLVAVAPLATAGFAGTDVVLPSVGRGPGQAGSQWHASVWIHNPGNAAVDVQLSLYLRDQVNPSPDGVYNDTIPAGDTRCYTDAVSTLFGVEGFGALRVTATQPVVVNGRIFSVEAGGTAADSVGQLFAAVPVTFAIAAGESTSVVGVYQTAPQASSDYRYNFGLMEVGGGAATVRVTVFSGDGAELGSKDYQLGSFQPLQKGVSDVVPGIDTQNARLEVEVLSGDGKVVAFGSGIANQGNDPSTFEMQFGDSLLGGSGGGLTLPYSDSGSTSASLFELVNTANGSTIHAVANTGTPIVANTQTGYAAMYAATVSTIGLRAYSVSGAAVDAESGSGTAIRASSDSGLAGAFEGGVKVGGGILQVVRATDAGLGSGGYLLLGDVAGSNLVFDNNEIMARTNGATSILYLQHEGGDVYVNGAVVHSSDRRLKREIRGLELGLDAVLRLRPVSYSYAWADREDDRRLGLIAQEVREVVGEAVHEQEDGMLGIDYESLVPVLIRAIQEQQQAIERLSGELQAVRGMR